MKKLFLSSIAVLVSAACFAQTNTAALSQTGVGQMGSITQTGSSLTSTISQVGTPTSNSGNVAITIQTGTGHQATIRQNISNYDRAAITQLNTTATPGGSNTATIDQSGSGGSQLQTGQRTGILPTAGNWAGVWQNGTGNQGTINQTGTGSKANFAEAWQQGSNNAATVVQSGSATQGKAEIFQGNDTRPNANDEGATSIGVSNNIATIDQTGSMANTAKIKQFSNGSPVYPSQTAEINQRDSHNNNGYITQGDGVNLTSTGSNAGAITQYGATVSGNSATVVQTGLYGSAFVGQYGSLAVTNNTALIHQYTGSYNHADIQQGAQYGAPIDGPTIGNAATISQYGTAYGDGVNSTDNTGQIVQDGAINNTATIAQGNSAASTLQGSTAYIEQIAGAVSNSATINQNTTTNGRANLAEINQETSQFNQALVSQQGSFNRAGLLQTGVGSNSATVTQLGDKNVLNGPGIPLLGGYPFVSTPNSYALQNGTGNRLTVGQTSPVGTSFVNTGFVNQTGMGNVITLNQTIDGLATAGNMATINQAGTANTATTTQSAQ